MSKTVSDLLIQRLLDWGVKTVFALPGDGINGIFEAWRQNADKLRYIQVRHEEAAAFAACGYAKYTGALGVCMATSGPGGIHLLNGLVLIKNNTLGQIKWEQMAFEGNPQFGVDLQPIDFAKYAEACGAAGYTIDDPTKAEGVLREAFAQPGPALVEAVVDANEPIMPGHVTLDQAWHFAKALVRGQKDGWDILKTVAENTVREVV